MKKQNQGVTLIALVITIIVLLILAGVSMNVIFGDNNLFEKAQQAKQETANAVANEQTQLNQMDNWITGDYSGSGNSNPPPIEVLVSAKDGSWNNKLKVNSPKTEGTGLKPVYWNGTTWVELTNESTQTEWNQWYDYANHKWANAQTADGSLWVWIPRYAYKIESGLGTSTAGTISIKFLQGITNNDETGTAISTTYPSVVSNAMTDYFVHPTFTTNVNAGGWRNELPGFWVAKYAAGFQNATAGETPKLVVEKSNELMYTTIDRTWTSNFLEENITANTKLSYPVFKADTYVYNLISVGDAYLLSKEIDTASMYGLNNTAIDSHLQKNSEWGAIAYLTHSSCGRNGTEVTVNERNLQNTNANVYAVTSYGPDNGGANYVAAGSTGNMTGVFDLSGCVFEHVACYLKGQSCGVVSRHSAMADRNTTISTEYVTLYTGNNLKGDATNETSVIQSQSWNGDIAYFSTAGSPTLQRGAVFNKGTKAGIFTYQHSMGDLGTCVGFRVCLAF